MTAASDRRAAGAAARRAGQPFTANPHPLGTGASKLWSRGWSDADAAQRATAS